MWTMGCSIKAGFRSLKEQWLASGPEEKSVQSFCEKEKDWLDDYALFMSLKDHFNGKPWQDWPDDLRRRQTKALERTRNQLEHDIQFWKGVQFLFFEQWDRLKRLAVEKGVSIIGDLPIYVAEDSADVWAHPEQFQMDDDLHPIRWQAVRRMAFLRMGSCGGNPLFHWERMRTDGYRWWMRRISFQFRFYDVLRIDHFRGFDAYYAISASAENAKDGTMGTRPRPWPFSGQWNRRWDGVPLSRRTWAFLPLLFSSSWQTPAIPA